MIMAMLNDHGGDDAENDFLSSTHVTTQLKSAQIS